MTNIEILESKLDYKFKDRNLLIEALTHPSVNFGKINYNTYERLEFLGDSILNFIITQELFSTCPLDSEGTLSKKRMKYICKETLGFIAKEMKLGEHLIISAGEEKSGGRSNINNLENTLEAIIAAIYLDSNIDIVRDIVKKLWKILETTDRIDPKTYIQEWVHSVSNTLPHYEVIETKGPSHNPEFKISLKIQGYEEVYGVGSSKKSAEKAAALNFIKTFLSK